MATPSEETKSTVSKMAMSDAKLAFTGVKKSFSAVKKLLTKAPTSEFVADEKETPVQVLGKIYKMMKIMDEDKKLNHEMANSFLEEEELEKNKRNQEIIKALTGRKTKKEIRQVYRDEKGRFKKEPGKEQPTTPSKGGEPVTSPAKPGTPAPSPAKPSTPVQPTAKPSQPAKIPDKNPLPLSFTLVAVPVFFTLAPKAFNKSLCLLSSASLLLSLRLFSFSRRIISSS